MSLKPSEFIRRLTMYILPDRFVKIGHYSTILVLISQSRQLKEQVL